MLAKLKVYVMHHRKNQQPDDYCVFASQKLANKEMAVQYAEAISDYDPEYLDNDETSIADSKAAIVSSEGKWEDWAINECALEINDTRSLLLLLAELFECSEDMLRRLKIFELDITDVAALLLKCLYDLKEKPLESDNKGDENNE